MPLRIGQASPKIGSAYLVAEAGVNHNGSVDAAIELVNVAYRAGADAVKFQVFRADRLVSARAPTAEYQQRAGQGPGQRAMLARLQLEQADFRRIAAHCHQTGIAFIATPFDPADVAFLQELGVPAIKIASPDLANFPLLDAAFSSGLPVILSHSFARWRR